MIRLNNLKSKALKLATIVMASTFILTACGQKETANKGATSSGENTNEIVVVTREEGSGTRGAFVELTGVEVKEDNGNKTDMTTVEAITQMKTDTVLTTVAGNPDAIGYVSTGSLNETIKALKVDGVEATSDNIKSGDYKISRPFNIAYKSKDNPVVEDFINFILSGDGQEIVAKSYIKVEDNLPAFTSSMPSGKIVVAGSSSVSPVMEKLIEAYLKVNTSADIELQQSDSSSGMKAAIDSTADIGMASRELKESETAELQHEAIALDGIAVIVNKENKVEDISMDNIRSIFIGEKTTWNELE